MATKSRSTFLLAAIIGLLALTGAPTSAKAAVPTKPKFPPGGDDDDDDGGGDGGDDDDEDNGGGEDDGDDFYFGDVPPTPGPGPTPVDLDPWLNEDPTWPMPETFYEVEEGDTWLGTSAGDSHSVVYSTLSSAAYVAAVEVGGLSHEGALQFANQVASNPNARLEYLDLIYCSPWNDSLYGTYGYDADFIGQFDSPAGRSIRLLPIHYDNFERISQGLAPRRNVRLGQLATKGDGSGTPIAAGENSFELVWLPGINLIVLWESQGETITTQGLTWEDGTTKLMPPPVVASLSALDVPQGQWGC